MMRFAWLCVMGCAVAEPEPELDVVFGIALPGETGQGRFLLGEETDELQLGNNHFSINGNVIESPREPLVARVRAQSGKLVAYDTNGNELFSGYDERFLDMKFHVTVGTSLEITGLYQANGPRYVFERTYGSKVVSFCTGATGENGAIVTRGSWSKTGAHNDDDRLTISCATGAITKCFDWGYALPDKPGNRDEQDVWAVHEACTRMTRADYCGKGISNTMDETSIIVRDHLTGVAFPNWGPNTPYRIPLAPTQPAPVNQYWLEALWGPAGALCLSEERWASMPVGDQCAELPDPRTNGSGGVFCEVMIDAPPKTPHLYNGSKVGQIALNSWTKAINNASTTDDDLLVTVRGRAGGSTKFLGYDYGSQIGLVIRNPPASLTVPDANGNPQLAAVRFQYNSTTFDRVATTASLTDYAPVPNAMASFDGYVYTSNVDHPERIEVRLYYNSDGDHVLGTTQPGTYSDGGHVGYIDPMPVAP